MHAFSSDVPKNKKKTFYLFGFRKSWMMTKEIHKQVVPLARIIDCLLIAVVQ